MESAELFGIINNRYAFNGFTVSGITNYKNKIVVKLKRKNRTGACPECGTIVKAEELIFRKVRSLDLSKMCFHEFRQARIRCKCGYRGMEKLDFVDHYARHTKRFEEYIVSLVKRMRPYDVSKICNVDMKTVQSIAMKYGINTSKLWKKKDKIS